MIRLIITILSVIVLSNCNSTTKKTNNLEDPKSPVDDSTTPVDTTPKVTGIGGIFFYSDNPQKTNEWYAKNLGLEINDWGSSSFESRNKSLGKRSGNC